MFDGPLVSVLMTTYNREKYLSYAVESVLKSTYQNLELIIVDDGSKDTTVSIARSYQEKDKRVRVYVNETNLGDYPNRNMAASYAKGKYLKYVDADDYIYPWGLELLVSMMEQFPGAGFGLCSLPQNEDRPFPFLLTSEDAYRYEYFGPGIFHKAPLSSLINREAFNSVGGFSGRKHLGDFEIWHLLSVKYPVVLMPDGIVWHRIHDEQQSSDNRLDPEVPFKYLVSACNFFRDCDKIPLDAATRNSVYKRLKNQILKSILYKLSKGKFSVAYTYYKASKKTEYNFSWDVLNK